MPINRLLFAELEAIYQGLKCCNDRRFQQIEVETDSELACNTILNRCIVACRYMYMVRKIRRLMSERTKIRHIYRQPNKVADAIATIAHGRDERRDFFELAEVPRSVQKLLFFDRIGLPCFRPNCN